MFATRIPIDTFKKLAINAGIVVDSFDIETRTIGNIMFATSGGINFTDTVNTNDFGEDIDNAPDNTMELKRLESHEIKLSGTSVTIDKALAKMNIGAADIDELDTNHIIPRNFFKLTDFKGLWFLLDYSDVNEGTSAGLVVVHLMNTLSTGGLQIQSADKAKTTFPFEYTAHYSMEAQDTVPYEIWIIPGEASVTPGVLFNTHTITLKVGDTYNLIATTIPADEEVAYSSTNLSKASVTQTGVVTANQSGFAIIGASITVDGVDYTDSCTVVVEPAPTP